MKAVIMAIALSSALATKHIPPLEDWVPAKTVVMEYPALARVAMIQGVVKVKCILNAEGNVVSADILEVSGSKTTREHLGGPALENARLWKFKPGKDSSAPGSAVIRYSFEFDVRHDPSYAKSKFVFEFPDSVRVIANLQELQITR